MNEVSVSTEALSVATLSLLALAGCGRELVNPASGAATFATHCAACHGRRGEGDGPVASTLSVRVPNLRTLAQRNGEFPTEWVASKVDGRDLPSAHGDRAMPVWGSVFDTTGQLFVGAENSKERIDALIEFLLELQVSE
ncbi:MAG TPA: cytochrome c [Gammaproteobacteria bacterium]